MTRTLAEPSTQVNLRMPNRILESIDKFALEKHHDRSSEINSACNIWAEAGGKDYRDATTLAKIDELDKKISSLETKLNAGLTELQSTKDLYLKIIKMQEETIERLLSTLPTAK